MPAEEQRVPVLLPRRVALPQREVHQLPLHVALLRQDQVSAELDTHAPLSQRAVQSVMRCKAIQEAGGAGNTELLDLNCRVKSKGPIKGTACPYYGTPQP